jgi:hypothetical protein
MKQAQATIRHFRHLLVFSGIFNILLASPLTLPGVADSYLFFLSDLNFSLHLGGTPYVRPLHPAHSLLINTAGIDLVLIGSMVLYAAVDPAGRRGVVLLNAIGRLLFASVMLYYVLAMNLMRLVLVVGFIDVAISIGIIVFLALLGKLERS